MDERPDLSVLSVAQKDGLILALLEQVKELALTVQTLKARMEQLEGRLRKDSHNSSKPPSSDGLGKKNKSLRQSSGRKPGGQYGHGGSTLKRVAHPDVVVEHRLAKRCHRCGAALGAQAEGLITVRRQVFDLIKPVLQVTEHRGHEVQCACGQQHSSEFPSDVVAAVQYGPVVKSAVVYLTQQQLLPMQRTVQLLEDLYGIELSAGTVQASIGQAAQRLTAAYERITQAVRVAPVVHFDETGQRVSGRLQWLHTASTPELTWYGAHDKRGRIAMDAAGILPVFQGVAVHDGWSSYREYDCTHALCNAHHLRELIYLEETTQQPWTRKMIDFLRAAQKEANAAKHTHRTVSRNRRAHLRRQYGVILSEGERDNPPSIQWPPRRGRIKQSPALNLLIRLRQHTTDVLRFLADLRVPFDNNQAERDIRMPKLKQKTSGCFRTVAGAENFAIIRSYLSTLRKQRRNVFHALTSVFQNKIPDPLAT